MSTNGWMEASSGIGDVPGYQLGSAACDVRQNGSTRLDVAVIRSDPPARAAAVFTRNRLAAAPVELCRERLAAAVPVHAVVVNSGNANACTGQQGYADAHEMAALAAAVLGCAAESVWVASTGRIGRRMPMAALRGGIGDAIGALRSGSAAGMAAADAILTSDTRRKVCSCRLQLASGTVHLGGMAKGAGMIEPDMATMLAFIATDAAIAPEHLQELLHRCVGSTFNAITVDGDQSTNDTVLVLANGASGVELSPASGSCWQQFVAALQAVCMDLARKIVGDGEKISKVVELIVDAAATQADAVAAARAIGNSLLVKSSWYGNDPNWGRVLDAVGYSGAAVSEQTVQMAYAAADTDNWVLAFDRGDVAEANLAAWKQIVAQPRFRIRVSLGTGNCATRLWATDLTEAYVNFNKSE